LHCVRRDRRRTEQQRGGDELDRFHAVLHGWLMLASEHETSKASAFIM
jgi:hypothetical protein